MADAGNQSVKSIAAGMLAKASSDTKVSAKGVVGNVIEGVTGQMKKYNEALEKHNRLKIEQAETTARASEIEDELGEIERRRAAHLFKTKEEEEAAIERTKELTAEKKKLTGVMNNNSKEMSKSTAQMEGMSKKGGILSNGLTILAAKTAGLAAAMSSWQGVVESLDKRLRYAGASIADTGEITGNFWETTKRIKDEALVWNEVIDQTNSAMKDMGYSIKDTDVIMASLSKGLRLTTEDQRTLAQQTGEMTEDIGRLAVLLRSNTEDLASATIVASKKFGKGAKAMNADLTQMHYDLTQLKTGSKDAVLHIGDLTQQVLESQAQFQGYNLSLRDQARLMSQISLRAQEQGATYEQSMKAAKGLTDIITGGKAPEWARFVAGNDLLDELKKTSKAAKGTMEEFKDSLIEAYSETVGAEKAKEMVDKMGKAQLEGLKNMAQNYGEYGGLSAAKMTEELLRGTAVGRQKMIEQLEKYAKMGEGRELLIKQWGFDEESATAALLALTEKDPEKKMSKLNKLLEVTKARGKGPPSIDAMEEQTKGMVGAIKLSQKGIMDSFKDYLGTDSVLVKAVVGIGGMGISGGLQLAQTGMMSKMAGGMAGMKGAGGTAMKGAAVVAAGAAGYAFGTKLREWSDALAESTGIQYLSIDKLAQTGLDTFAKQVDLATFGLISFRGDLEGAELAQKSYAKTLELGGAKAEDLLKIQEAARGGFDESSKDFAIQARRLEGLKAEELQGMADALGVSFGRLQQMQDKALSVTEFQKRFVPAEVESEIAAEKTGGTPGVASSADAKARKAPKKAGPPPVVTVTRLTPQQKQAVSMQVAEKLEPEVAKIASTMFEKLSVQGTEYYENLTSVSQVFWGDTLPKMAELTWDSIAVEFERKLDRIAGPAMTPVAFGPEGAPGAGGGPGSVGGMAAAVGPDGSITIKMMIPRDAIDASNRTAEGYNT